eukprot:Skav228474  [mRNA]  locus=scaffold2004:17714:20745:+ [translate_table: standard]
MLGDLMERSSLAEALDKISSDVATQNAQGLDALKTWLEDRAKLEKADDDAEVWPAVLKALNAHGKRQLEALARAGGRKGTFKAEGPSLLLQVLQHLGRRVRKASPSEKLLRWQQSHGVETFRFRLGRNEDAQNMNEGEIRKMENVSKTHIKSKPCFRSEA